MAVTTGFYAITCPNCEGRMFIDQTLCATCQGEGRLLIPENDKVFRINAKQAIAITISAALLILAIVALMASL